MTIENQVCTLEQGEKLKELGISRESYFSWFGDKQARLMDNCADGIAYGAWLFVSTTEPPNNIELDWREDVGIKKLIAPAYTCSELGIMLPPFFPTFVHDGKKYSHCGNERVDTFPLLGGETEYDETPAHILNKQLVPIQTAKTEAQARATMLIFLLENSLITVEYVNDEHLK